MISFPKNKLRKSHFFGALRVLPPFTLSLKYKCAQSGLLIPSRPYNHLHFRVHLLLTSLFKLF